MRDELEPRLPFEDERPEFEWTDDGAPIDPHDTLADPERRERVTTNENEWARQERNADGVLSDFGSAAIHRRWSRHDEE